MHEFHLLTSIFHEKSHKLERMDFAASIEVQMSVKKNIGNSKHSLSSAIKVTIRKRWKKNTERGKRF